MATLSHFSALLMAVLCFAFAHSSVTTGSRSLSLSLSPNDNATASKYPGEIERGQYWWTFPDTDCMPNDEIGYCGTSSNFSVPACKAACFENPNCAGFNSNGHLKKIGCVDELIPWGDDPGHVAPIDPGHHAVTLYTLSLYPPRREYWWELPGWDCNPDHELGTCKVEGMSPREQLDHCKEVCENDIFCEGFNLPNGHMKAAGCKDDLIFRPEWSNGTMRLYYRRGHPQLRDPKRTRVVHVGKADCNPGQEIGNCSSYLRPPYTESDCAAACLKNPLCGGFNLPNGHLKTVDCLQEISSSENLDLYIMSYPAPTPGSKCEAALQQDCGRSGDRENCLNCVDSDQTRLEKICSFSEIAAFCDKH